jgi:hypothetical protein
MHAFLTCLLISIVAAFALYTADTLEADGVSVKPIIYWSDRAGLLHAVDVNSYAKIDGFPLLLGTDVSFDSHPLVAADTVIVSTSYEHPLKLFIVGRNNATVIAEWIDNTDPRTRQISGVHMTYLYFERQVIVSCNYVHLDLGGVWTRIRIIDLYTRKLRYSEDIPVTCDGRLRDVPYCVEQRALTEMSNTDSVQSTGAQ